VVHDLSARILLIGLNAQVQAARVGQGGGLEVLSAHTSEISQATNRISERVAQQLDELAGGLAENVRAFEQLRLQAEAQQALVNSQGRGQEQELHAFRDAALGTLHDMATTLEEFRKQAVGTLERLRFQEHCQPPSPRSEPLWKRSPPRRIAGSRRRAAPPVRRTRRRTSAGLHHGVRAPSVRLGGRPRARRPSPRGGRLRRGRDRRGNEPLRLRDRRRAAPIGCPPTHPRTLPAPAPAGPGGSPPTGPVPAELAAAEAAGPAAPAEDLGDNIELF